MALGETGFWEIIGLLNWDATGDDDLVVEPAIKSLVAKPESEIFDFEEHLSHLLYKLDTLQHARHIGEDAYKSDKEHFSVDQFLYARCVVVANGPEFFNQVLNRPSTFPKDMEFESLLYIASSAYEEKTGKEFDFVPKYSSETFSNKIGWEPQPTLWQNLRAKFLGR